MDHSNHPRLDDTEYTEAVLDGATVYGPDNQTIGTVSHTHGSGLNAEVVIDVGGFLGIGAKPVMVPAHQLDFMRDESGTVHAVTTWTKDDLKSMPRHEH
ncbi:PRC-barrel domain containing protein [Paracoccus sp. (in: a-proteobacteria)]|uniref:PRC-barrel domain containing protein n=1 Tax=Paracoccus sp. TaxID=267 RepID=UPI00396CF66D